MRRTMVAIRRGRRETETEAQMREATQLAQQEALQERGQKRYAPFQPPLQPPTSRPRPSPLEIPPTPAPTPNRQPSPVRRRQPPPAAISGRVPRSESAKEQRLRRQAQMRQEGEVLKKARRQEDIEKAREEETQRIADAIAARTAQLGQGVKVLHPRPGRGVKIGKGLPENTRGVRYAQFGKYIIHLPSLDKQTISIKYPSVLAIQDIPNKHVSNNFVKLIRHYLETDTIDKGMFNALEEDEQEFFHYLTRRCAVDTGMVGGGMTNREKKDMERFELIRGQVIAGNNSPELLKELKQYLLKFLSEKRITRAVGNQILYEIAMLS